MVHRKYIIDRYYGYILKQLLTIDTFALGDYSSFKMMSFLCISSKATQLSLLMDLNLGDLSMIKMKLG